VPSKKTRKERVKNALARIGVKNALRVFLPRPSGDVFVDNRHTP
jgi:hypothetical protein